MIGRYASQFSASHASANASAGGTMTASYGGNDDRGPATLLVASGRGGSGTTIVSALLAVCAAGDGHRVLLVDADDFVGPLAMMLGVQPVAGWQDLRGGRVGAAAVATPVSTTLTLVAGGAARVGAAEPGVINAAERRACMRRLSALTESVDLVVIDCGSRLDTILGAVTPHADERLVAVTAGSDPVAMAATFALCKAVHARHGSLPMDVLVNRHQPDDAVRCFDAIDAGVRQFLGTTTRLAGAVPSDSTLDAALRAGMGFPDAAAGSPAATACHDAVTRVLAGISPLRPGN